MEEQNLLRKLKKGRRDTLEKVIDLYTPYVTVIVHQIIGHTMTREDVEEVVSDVFISLWNHIENLDEEKGNLRGYIAASARNRAKNKLREHRPSADIEDWDASDFRTPDKEIEEKEAREMVWNLIMGLGEPDSEIFYRYYHCGEGIRQIAGRTGIVVSTVKTKLFRGRKAIKQQLMEKGGKDYE